jgi:hypothetical protein
MSDLAKWHVQGSVRTLKTEVAEWDLSQAQWGLPEVSLHLSSIQTAISARAIIVIPTDPSRIGAGYMTNLVG